MLSKSVNLLLGLGNHRYFRVLIGHRRSENPFTTQNSPANGHLPMTIFSSDVSLFKNILLQRYTFLLLPEFLMKTLLLYSLIIWYFIVLETVNNPVPAKVSYRKPPELTTPCNDSADEVRTGQEITVTMRTSNVKFTLLWTAINKTMHMALAIWKTCLKFISGASKRSEE